MVCICKVLPCDLTREENAIKNLVREVGTQPNLTRVLPQCLDSSEVFL